MMNAPPPPAASPHCYTCTQSIDDRGAVAVRIGTRSVKLCAPCAQARFSVVVFSPRRAARRRQASEPLKPEVFAGQ
jgi:hypothetical protein